MKIKTNELEGAALDWAVARCQGFKLNGPYECFGGAFCLQEEDGSDGDVCPSYSTDWAQGGLIIDDNSISIIRCEDDWTLDAKGYWTEKSKRIPVWAATIGQHDTHSSYEGEHYPDQFEIPESEVCYGSTPLIAAMRCYVASKLGDEVKVPDELKEAE